MKKTKTQPKTYYKVLDKNGKSAVMATEWPMPTKKNPGAWVELDKKTPLKECFSGLHLTAYPAYYWQEGRRIFLAEYEGQHVQGENAGGNDLVCRKARLVREVVGDELKRLLIDCWHAQKSPAFELVRIVWVGAQKATGHSWTRLNSALRDAVRLAISAGLRFDRYDFEMMYTHMRGGYWFCGEDFFAHAVEYGNTSACVSYEDYVGRPPFVLNGRRLHVGERFAWDGMKLAVTSFVSDSLIACSYKKGDHHPAKIERRVTIHVEQIRSFEKERLRKMKEAKAEERGHAVVR